jgi:hypothetical protein
MGAVHQPIEDRVAKRGVADKLVPVVHRELAGAERGAAAAPVFDDFEETTAFPIAERGQSAVIEDE